MKNANNKMYSAEPVSMDKVINIAIEKLAKISNDPSGLSGIPSGFHELDQLTSGWSLLWQVGLRWVKPHLPQVC